MYMSYKVTSKYLRYEKEFFSSIALIERYATLHGSKHS